MKKKIVAIITARGGSKGLPRKNVLDLNGKPLIAWTIESALASTIFSKVIVSTDDTEIKEISLEFGTEVIDRPSELATSEASSIDVVLHSLKLLAEEKFTHFMLLQPTSPLRNEQHIKESWNKYIKDSANSLVSVSEVSHPPQKMLIVSENGDIKPFTKWEDLTKPRQSLEKAYMPNGAIYINNIENFMENKNLFNLPLSLFSMNSEYSIDIDSKEDLLMAEKYLKEVINGNSNF